MDNLGTRAFFTLVLTCGLPVYVFTLRLYFAFKYTKVKVSRYRPGQALGVPGG